MQFATNHLGHFALANGLHDALALAGGARVVSVSSAAHQRSPVVFEDIHFERREYEPWLAYGQSKTANVLFAVALEKRLGAAGVHANALHPGGTDQPQRYLEERLQRLTAPSRGAVKTRRARPGPAGRLATGRGEWAAETSPRRRSTSPAPAPAWPRTRWTRPPRTGSGRCPSSRCPPEHACRAPCLPGRGARCCPSPAKVALT